MQHVFWPSFTVGRAASQDITLFRSMYGVGYALEHWSANSPRTLQSNATYTAVVRLSKPFTPIVWVPAALVAFWVSIAIDPFAW